MNQVSLVLARLFQSREGVISHLCASLEVPSLRIWAPIERMRQLSFARSAFGNPALLAPTSKHTLRLCQRVFFIPVSASLICDLPAWLECLFLELTSLMLT